MVYRDFNGYSVGYAQLYSIVIYAPNSSTYIKYIEFFQDAYASYLVYDYEMGKINASQLPGDVQWIGNGKGYSPGYWTNTYYTPYPMQCATTENYKITLTLSYTSQALSASSTYGCTQTVILVKSIPSELTR